MQKITAGKDMLIGHSSIPFAKESFDTFSSFESVKPVHKEIWMIHFMNLNLDLEKHTKHCIMLIIPAHFDGKFYYQLLYILTIFNELLNWHILFICHLSMMIQHSSLSIGQYVFPLSFALGEIFPGKSRPPDQRKPKYKHFLFVIAHTTYDTKSFHDRECFQLSKSWRGP